MVQQVINVGTLANDRTGDTWRDAFLKANANDTELYSQLRENTVIINEEANFPVQDASTITCESQTIYIISAAFTTGKTFTMQPGSCLKSNSQLIPGLTYSGTGVMFNTTGIVELVNLSVSCANGTLLAATGVGGFVIVRNFSASAVKDLGTITNAGLLADGFTAQSITGQGFQLFGSTLGFQFTSGTLIGSAASFIGIDLGSATMPLFRLSNSTIAGPAGAISISGLASSGNIITGQRAIVETANIAGNAITPLSGIDAQDVLWNFRAVTGVADSRNAADAYLTATRTVTIGVAGTFVVVNGPNWSTSVSDRFTVSTSGVITYIGDPDIEVEVLGTATIEKVGGGADELEVRMAKNGTTESRSGTVTSNATPTSVPSQMLTDLSTGNTISMYVANNDSTANVDVLRASIIVVGS